MLDENGHIGASLHHVEDVTAAVKVIRGQQLGEEQQETVRAIAMTAARLHATAAASDFTAAAAYPLALVDLPLGVLTLYRRGAGIHPSHSEQLEAGLIAEIARASVLADTYQSGNEPDAGQSGSRHHRAGLLGYLGHLHPGDTSADVNKT